MGSIRSELRRFERRRLRPLFRFLRFGRGDSRLSALVGAASRSAGGAPTPEMEELLVAMIRAELRRDPRRGASVVPDAPTGSAALDSFVRAMLAARPAGDAHPVRRDAA